MDPVDPQDFKDRSAWRDWLAKNHASTDSLWVVTHKKADPGPGLRYVEGVEEALCYGWIDGQMRSVDEKTFVQRYTPRRPGSRWSATNVERAEKLLAKDKIAPPGLAEIEAAKADGRWDKALAQRRPAYIKGELADALRDEPEASAFLDSLAMGQRNTYLGWVAEAKTPATREKRAAEAVERLRRGLKPGQPLE